MDWAETSLLDGIFAPREAKLLSGVIARLGLADVRAFGLKKLFTSEQLGIADDTVA